MQLPGLRRERELRHLTQRALAARAGVSAPTIVGIEAGRACGPRVAEALTRALELVPVSDTARQLQGALS